MKDIINYLQNVRGEILYIYIYIYIYIAVWSYISKPYIFNNQRWAQLHRLFFFFPSWNHGWIKGLFHPKWKPSWCFSVKLERLSYIVRCFSNSTFSVTLSVFDVYLQHPSYIKRLLFSPHIILQLDLCCGWTTMLDLHDIILLRPPHLRHNKINNVAIFVMIFFLQ